MTTRRPGLPARTSAASLHPRPTTTAPAPGQPPNATSYVAVVLAGPGEGLFPLVNTLPTAGGEEPGLAKAALPVLNRPMVDFVLDWVADSGLSDVLLLAAEGQRACLAAATRTRKPALAVRLECIPDSDAAGLGTADTLRWAIQRGLITTAFVLLPCDLYFQLRPPAASPMCAQTEPDLRPLAALDRRATPDEPGPADDSVLRASGEHAGCPGRPRPRPGHARSALRRAAQPAGARRLRRPDARPHGLGRPLPHRRPLQLPRPRPRLRLLPRRHRPPPRPAPARQLQTPVRALARQEPVAARPPQENRPRVDQARRALGPPHSRAATLEHEPDAPGLEDGREAGRADAADGRVDAADLAHLQLSVAGRPGRPAEPRRALRRPRFAGPERRRVPLRLRALEGLRRLRVSRELRARVRRDQPHRTEARARAAPDPRAPALGPAAAGHRHRGRGLPGRPRRESARQGERQEERGRAGVRGGPGGQGGELGAHGPGLHRRTRQDRELCARHRRRHRRSRRAEGLRGRERDRDRGRLRHEGREDRSELGCFRCTLQLPLVSITQ
ncbi:hypothetical protein PTTG_28728 [Puccinia triticina 1-1 BBBD Race 1]|uniref:Translation initiation factor eIF2B subunit gamma n=1 Tax=Puccinia triticina (isolate 1-1 / race 1 (BBBD)) TaxID=630390 RepID=A0A180G9Y5_PUCT1|nr:hypothetical protein PTTG_28728 [Puccinia triticina 1-1 BBBD Race 1]